MLSVFGDDSSDETKERVFAVGGVIGTEELWRNLEAGWLIRTEGIPFHAKDCDSDFGDYKDAPHKQNKALYRDLTIMLAKSGLGGWAFIIDLLAQRRLFPGSPDIAYYRCFVEVLRAMRNCAVNNRDTVRFTFDMRRESEYNAGLLYAMFRESPEYNQVMFPEVSFACSREQPRLQAADLFAHEAMKTYDNRFGPVRRPVRKSWLALKKTDRFHLEAIGEDWFVDLKNRMADLEKSTGQSKADYLAWLKQHRLQHCTSNLFRYIDWKERQERGGL